MLTNTTRLFGLATSLAALSLSACGTTTLGSGSGEVVKSDIDYNTNPTPPADDYATVVSGTNQFGFDLFKKIATNTENLAFSPTSTTYALAMTYAGARGNTEAQMAAVLHNSLPQDRFHAALNRLSLDLASRNMDPKTENGRTQSVSLSLINALWADKTMSFVSSYLDTVSVNYDAGVHVLDFQGNPEDSRNSINSWVSDATHEKVTDLLPPGSINSSTALVLTNALYFKATWATGFQAELTKEDTFHLANGSDVTASMMIESDSFRYGAFDGYELMELPYSGNALAMTLILPAEGSFETVRASLSSDWLTGALEKASTAGVTLRLPKFRFTWGTAAFRQPLEALGMVDAFNNANFSGLSPEGLAIADVYHKAFIGVDESGTEAAAATAVAMLKGGMPQVSMTLNRPFLFLIRDTTSGAVLFVGQMVDPTAG